MAAYPDGVNSVKIASIHFFPLKAKRNYRAKGYDIPAVGLNDPPFILSVLPLIERGEGPVITGPGGGRRQKLAWPVRAEEIAHCLVNEWTGVTVGSLGMDPQCHPGTWVVREKIPVTEQVQKLVDGQLMTFEEKMMLDAQGDQMFRQATPEEREEMWQEDLLAARSADRNYAEWCWNQGNRIHGAIKSGVKDDRIPRTLPPIYKAAVKQYGLQAEWLTEAVAQDSVVCQNCGTPGSKLNFMCQKCGEPTDVERWAQWKVRKDAAIKAAEAGLAGKHGGKQPLPPPIAAPQAAA